MLPRLRVVVCLGKIGFDAMVGYFLRADVLASRKGYEFAHGAEYPLPNGLHLLATYHPSLQNTNTGKLTAPMFLKIFMRARELAKAR